MLELRPSCEHCDKSLPPEALDARICSYECTFCVDCIENVLKNNICPNCGGGFSPRPIRPAKNWKNQNYLGNDPATNTVKHEPVDLAAYKKLVDAIGSTPPDKR